MVGLSAPQGAGKTTLSSELVDRLTAQGLRAVSVSIDDFYLTRTEQERLAKLNPDNPYLQKRGYPGTHDVALGEDTLLRLRSLGPGERMLSPSYDKSAYDGLGDRKAPNEWTQVTGPLDAVFLEGWMLGFQPVIAERLPNHSFIAINEHLKAYEKWLILLDAFISLRPLDPRFTIDWRIEAEEKMKALGRPGMSLEDVRAYIESFLPAYETYQPGLPAFLDRRFPSRHLTLTLDKDRNPL